MSKNRLKFSYQNACQAEGAPSAAQVRRWVALACNLPAEVTVRIVGEVEGAQLNKSYRNKAHPTNVLTFDYAHSPEILADLVICAAVVAREATQQNKRLLDHYAHMVVHGCLHAQGFDHETNEADAIEMEALEILLMGALGFDNPY